MRSGRVGRRLVLIVVDGFVLGWWDVAAPGVKPAVVPPVDVLEGCQLDVVEVASWAVPADQLGLV